MILFCSRPEAEVESILSDGFTDDPRDPVTLRQGVLLTDIPPDRIHGRSLLVVELLLPESAIARKAEAEYDGKGHREFVVPARIIEKHGKVRRGTDADYPADEWSDDHA
jgi:hypothetical protein